MNEPLFFQFFELESSTYTYLLADKESKEGVLIDSVLETVERDLQFIRELEINLVYLLETHVHADHVTGASKIRKALDGKPKIGVSAAAKLECCDVHLKEGQKLNFGKHEIQVIATPGHTDSCLSYLIGDRVFTGDALLIHGCGRTDFQQGSATKLYNSVTKKLFELPDNIRVYPAHDYQGRCASTIGLEKKYNLRLGSGKSLEDFTKIMDELNLAKPKKIDIAVPANMKCGQQSLN